MNDGFVRVEDGAEVVSLVEERLADGAWWAERHDRWLADGVPALSRGEVWLLPLAWLPATHAADQREDLTQLWLEVRGALEYRSGWPLGIDLDAAPAGDNGYQRSLARAGAYRADWSALRNGQVEAAVVNVCARRPDGAISHALHVVPVEWLRWRPGSKPKRATSVPETELDWSWADVVALYEATADADANATESQQPGLAQAPAPQRRDGRSSRGRDR